MNINNVYELIKDKPNKDISIGYQTVNFINDNDLIDAQNAYKERGILGVINALLGRGWKKNWIVIATDGYFGDPIFIDINNISLPVFIAAHGEGKWEPILIASTYSKFIDALNLLETISKGRETPVDFEKNPISELKKNEILDEIRENNQNVNMSFWESWFEI